MNSEQSFIERRNRTKSLVKLSPSACLDGGLGQLEHPGDLCTKSARDVVLAQELALEHRQLFPRERRPVPPRARVS